MVRVSAWRDPTGFDNPPPALPTPTQVSAAFDEVLTALRAAGATDRRPRCGGLHWVSAWPSATGESLVLDFDFKGDVQNYFATRVGVPMAGKTLQMAIDFNNDNADAEMPFWSQEIFLQAESLLPGATRHNRPTGVPAGTTYTRRCDRQTAVVNGIDLALLNTISTLW